MARINSVSIGRAAKKLGNMVYYTMNGKTYARARVEQVKNPKTPKQMAQRVIFTTAVRSRDALKSIVDHSFENKKYGSESLNYFMKRNLEILRARAAEDNGTIGAFNVPYGITMQANPLLISQGTLASMQYFFDNTAGLYFSIGSGSEVTVGTFLSSNTVLRKGDQITVLLLVPTGNYEATTASGEGVNATRLLKMRITIPANVADDAVFFDKVNSSFGPLMIVEGVENFTFESENDGTTLAFRDNVNDDFGSCGCIIVSRPEGNKWLRSTEYLKMNPNYDDALYYFNDVLNTWMQGTTEIAGLEDNEYLNQGQQASVENTYSVQTRSFNMSEAATGAISGVSLAALDTVTASGSKSSQIIYTQTAQQAIDGEITCYKQGTAANTLVALGTAYNKPSNAAAIIKFADANKLLGGVLSIVTEWRGKTSIEITEIDVTDAMRPALQQAFGNLVSTARMLEFPSARTLNLRKPNGGNESHIVANADGTIINATGQAAEIHVFYPAGSSEEDEYISFSLNNLRILAAAGLTNSGTPFAATSVTLDEYNSAQVAHSSTEWEW